MYSFWPTLSVIGETFVTTGFVDFLCFLCVVAADAGPAEARAVAASRTRVERARLFIDPGIGAVRRGLEAPRCFFSDGLVAAVRDDPLSHVDGRRAVPEAGRPRGQAEVPGAGGEGVGCSLRDR